MPPAITWEVLENPFTTYSNKPLHPFYFLNSFLPNSFFFLPGYHEVAGVLAET
jgi:hypothetical protein